ncbi:MAG: ankyrin repeat domain-containing protein [Tatlockia sp.]|nr:ankyrin repeat domain-containing protein [Tatlockia sp.]
MQIKFDYNDFFDLPEVGYVDPNTLTSDIDVLFRFAAASGDLEALNLLIEQNPGRALSLIKAKGYAPFLKAAENGHLEVLKWLLEKALVAEDENDESNKSEESEESDESDILDELDILKENEMGITAFYNALSNGHLEILKWLKEKSPSELFNRANDQFGFFARAGEKGYLEILKWLNEQYPAALRFKQVFYTTLGGSACGGHLKTAKWLMNQAPELALTTIQHSDYEIFVRSAYHGQLIILKWLINLYPESAMIQAQNYGAFHHAVEQNHFEIIQLLLSYPQCFAFAEQHLMEYGTIIGAFIIDTISTLHQDAEIFLNRHPDELFDIQTEAHKFLCFYIIRHLIRLNDSSKNEMIRFLLNLPSVKTIAHHEITRGDPNELLRLAISIGNQEAAVLLLNIDEVRLIAQQNNFYQDEQNNGIDLGQLAQDRESSMTALTEGEAKRLKAAILHYKPMIQKVGVKTIVQALKDDLAERYIAAPASITVNNILVKLPLTYQEFESLNLSENKKKKALCQTKIKMSPLSPI